MTKLLSQMTKIKTTFVKVNKLKNIYITRFMTKMTKYFNIHFLFYMNIHIIKNILLSEKKCHFCHKTLKHQ
jgi:hypothetical protein